MHDQGGLDTHRRSVATVHPVKQRDKTGVNKGGPSLKGHQIVLLIKSKHDSYFIIHFHCRLLKLSSLSLHLDLINNK